MQIYQESFTPYKNTMLYQISRMNSRDTLIVFFHGLGDSHLNFTCFFNSSELGDYDLFIADLLGHGRSGASLSYTFSEQIDALASQIHPFIPNYKTIIFVPHSMGGIHATLLAASRFSKKINGIYAIETSITQYGSFVAKKVGEVIKKGQLFSDWFQIYCEDIYNLGLSSIIFRRYYAGLQFVRGSAFLDNALEMYELATSFTHSAFTHKIGYVFANLPIPKVYCLGEGGQQLPSLPFLEETKIKIEYFKTDCHWVAQANLDDFCRRLHHFVQKIKKPKKAST